MLKKIHSFSIDAAMALLMYYGLYLGNEYAINIFWPTLWVLVFLSFVVWVIFSNKETKVMIKEKRVPKKQWENKYSLLYDTAFSIGLAALGFAWSAAIWWAVQWLARACVEALDQEVREEANSC
ncbi:hypothetical protein [Pseudoalteromonas rhizosphaerae]|uniref:hypothetical protein n=1 Tax=Pseudoalteromonas rhizosphaerae TaxID=2518973 RepID=UPI00384C3B60